MTLVARTAFIAAALLPSLASAQPATPERSAEAPVRFTEEERRKILQHFPLPPPPSDPTNRVADDPAAVEFGHALFFDARLSPDGEFSCASCHDAAKGLTDGKPLAEGVGKGTRSAPTLWNVAYNRWYFWDGRSDSLWAQVVHPIESPVEMNSSRLRVAHLVHNDAKYRRRYESLFGDMPPLSDAARFPPDAKPVPENPNDPANTAWTSMSAGDRNEVNRVLINIAKAIAAYERRLVSRHSPFDRFAEGLAAGDAEKLAALSPSAQRGLRLFVGSANCRLCHSGPNFSDGEFHNVRVPPHPDGRRDDPGRHEGAELVRDDPFNARGAFSDARTGPAADKIDFLANTAENWGRFKTPTLRNVALTAPYMHQGQFATLREVLEYYSTLEEALPPGHHETETILEPLMLSDRQIADLEAFLRSLTDESIDPALLRPPGGDGPESP